MATRLSPVPVSSDTRYRHYQRWLSVLYVSNDMIRNLATMCASESLNASVARDYRKVVPGLTHLFRIFPCIEHVIAPWVWWDGRTIGNKASDRVLKPQIKLVHTETRGWTTAPRRLMQSGVSRANYLRAAHNYTKSMTDTIQYLPKKIFLLR